MDDQYQLPAGAMVKPEELAKVARVDRRVIDGMIKRGELTGIKFGRVMRIPREEAEALLRGGKKKPQASESGADQEEPRKVNKAGD